MVNVCTWWWCTCCGTVFGTVLGSYYGGVAIEVKCCWEAAARLLQCDCVSNVFVGAMKLLVVHGLEVDW